MQDTKIIAVIGHLSIDKIKVEKCTYNNMLGGAVLYSALAMAHKRSQVHVLSTYCEDFDIDSISEISNSSLFLNQVVPILGNQRRAFMEYTKDFKRTSHNHARKEWLKDTIKQSPRNVPDLTLKYDAVMLVPMLPEVQNEYIQWFRTNTQALIGLDTSEYYAQNNRSQLKDIIKKVDIFLPSDIELNYLFPENENNIHKHITSLLELGLHNFVIKMSTKGSLIVDKNKEITWCGIRKTNAIDATGAGDSFAGSLMQQYLFSKNIVEATKHAAVISSLCVEKVGFSGLLKMNHDFVTKEKNKIHTKKEI